MTLPRLAGLREYGKRGPPRSAAARPDAGQGPDQGSPRSGGVVLRAEMGRLPSLNLSRYFVYELNWAPSQSRMASAQPVCISAREFVSVS
jgi:hypothetical protein